jgi:hypothetical protein
LVISWECAFPAPTWDTLRQNSNTSFAGGAETKADTNFTRSIFLSAAKQDGAVFLPSVIANLRLRVHETRLGNKK